jgi:hypothetical protein
MFDVDMHQEGAAHDPDHRPVASHHAESRRQRGAVAKTGILFSSVLFLNGRAPAMLTCLKLKAQHSAPLTQINGRATGSHKFGLD